MSIHIVKLVVGVESLEEYAAWLEGAVEDYHGQPATAVWTRHMPKRADELVREGSLYRVIKNRIQCRQRILGFEKVEHPQKGTMCRIMVEHPFIQTMAQPHRPFQGWRYLDPAKTPKDIGPFAMDSEAQAPPPELARELKDAGLL